MKSNLALITAPTTPVMTTEEAKMYANIDANYEDILFPIWIEAATNEVQTNTGKQLITATYRLDISCIPSDGRVVLPRPPLASVSSVKYTNQSGVEQTLSAAEYQVHTPLDQYGYVHFTGDLPSDIDTDRDDVYRITFIAGYGYGEDVPGEAKVAMGSLIAAWHRNREAWTESNGNEVPFGPTRIMNQMQIWRLGGR